MSVGAKLSLTLVVFLIATTVLGGCSVTAPETVQTLETPVPTAVATPVSEASSATEATDPDSCAGLSQVVSESDGLYWERRGSLRDLGAREFAQGEVIFSDDGAPVAYAVASGDVESLIAERLCAYPNLAQMNHVRVIHPGQVLWLTPDPAIPWVPYYAPGDAPAGFEQIPYQQAIESAGAAVDAGDVDTVRSIWNDTLKPMFANQTTIDAVQEVVDAGDLDALRQLFS